MVGRTVPADDTRTAGCEGGGAGLAGVGVVVCNLGELGTEEGEVGDVAL